MRVRRYDIGRRSAGSGVRDDGVHDFIETQSVDRDACDRRPPPGFAACLHHVHAPVARLRDRVAARLELENSVSRI